MRGIPYVLALAALGFLVYSYLKSQQEEPGVLATAAAVGGAAAEAGGKVVAGIVDSGGGIPAPGGIAAGIVGGADQGVWSSLKGFFS